MCPVKNLKKKKKKKETFLGLGLFFLQLMQKGIRTFAHLNKRLIIGNGSILGYNWSTVTFTVLAAGAPRGVAVAGELMVRRWLTGEGMRGVWLVGEGVHHGPRGSAWERQWSQGVLVWGPAGTVVVVQGQVGHVWVRQSASSFSLLIKSSI